jgi:hypothetical protein
MTQMELFDFNSHQADCLMPTDYQCTADLTDMITVTNIGQGMDPLQAALEAQLQAPLIRPFLF